MKTIYFDTETDGLYGKVMLAQWKDTKVHVKEMKSEQDLRDVKTMLKQADKVVGHNILYDFYCLGLDPAEVKWEDTFLLSKLAMPKMESWKLNKVAEEILGFNVYGDIDKKAMQKSDWTTLTEEQLKYASLDVEYLDTIYKSLRKAEKEFNYTLDKLTAECFWKAKTAMPVNRLAMEERQKENAQEVERLNLPINVNSYKQVRKYLDYDKSNDEALAYLIARGTKEQQEKAFRVRKARKLRKQNSFADKYIDLSREDGYIYGHLGLAPRSGRSNCDHENLQQIPGKLKDCFASNKYVVYADFSNLELRTFCAVVGERTMEKLLRQDVDLHTYTATRLFNKSKEEITKRERQIAKIFNFSSLYGAGVDRRRQILLTLVGIYLSHEEASLYVQRWNNAFPQVKAWHNENVKKWRAGYIEQTILGRPYKAKLLTDYNNIRISGSAAEVAKLTMHYMSKKLDIGRMNVFVHDSYTFECDSLKEAKEYAKIVGDSMKEAWYEVMQYSIIPDLPMPVEVTVGKPGASWYDIQEGVNCEYIYRT